MVKSFFDKDFDCVEMKNEIQAKIYLEIKDMSADERIAYFHIPVLDENIIELDAKVGEKYVINN